MNEFEPTVDDWYEPYENGQPFMVLATDEDADLIEIQYFNGDIAELSFAQWRELDIELCASPESWAGTLDIADNNENDAVEIELQEWAIEQEVESHY